MGKEKKATKDVITKAAADFLKGNIAAAKNAGETLAMDRGLSAVGEAAEIMNPVKLIFSELLNAVKAAVTVFKDKKKLIFVLLLAAVWILLAVLKMLRFNALPVSVLSFLSFAQGGMSGKPLEMVGGILGKGIFAFFLTSFMLPIFGQGRQDVLSRLKTGFSGFKTIAAHPSLTLGGVSAALIFYNFTAGSISPEKSMAAISCGLLSLYAGGNLNGFLFRLFKSLIAKYKQMSAVSAQFREVTAGMGIGFAFSAVLSFIPWGYAAYAVGVLIGIAATALGIMKKDAKGESAK